MRVLTFTSLFPNTIHPDFSGFVARRMEAWAAKYAERWAVVAPAPFFPKLPFECSWAKFSKIPFSEIRGQWSVLHPRYFMLPKVGGYFQGLSMARGAMSSIKRLWREEGPFDLIDAHFVYPDGYAALRLGQIFRVPVIISARGTDIHLYSKLFGISRMVKTAVRKADSCIAVCEALGDEMKRLGANPHNMHVIPNGIDAEKFQVVERKDARARLGLPRDLFIYLSVGNLIELKGHHLLIEAFHKADFDDKTKLYIVGTGPLQNELRKYISGLDLCNRVFLTGYIPNGKLSDWYNAADCFCLCSSREGWANVIMESLACGTPVIATNVWGVPEIITRPEVGILVERNVNSIKHGMLTAKEKSWDRKLIRRHVESRTWDIVADEVQAVFEKVLSKRRTIGGTG